MLKIKDNIITNKYLEIKKRKQVVKVFFNTPADPLLFLVFTLDNTRAPNVFPMTRMEDGTYAGQVVVTEDMMQAKEVECCVKIMTDSEDFVETNSILVLIDKSNISNAIKDAQNVAIVQLNKDIAALKEQMNKCLSGLVPEKLPSFDKNLVKKGMVYMAIGDKGPFVFSYPFIDNITKINGKKSVAKEITLTGEDIFVNEKSETTIDKAITKLIEASNKNTQAVSEISKLLKEQNEILTKVQLSLVDLMED